MELEDVKNRLIVAEANILKLAEIKGGITVMLASIKTVQTDVRNLHTKIESRDKDLYGKLNDHVDKSQKRIKQIDANRRDVGHCVWFIRTVIYSIIIFLSTISYDMWKANRGG